MTLDETSEQTPGRASLRAILRLSAAFVLVGGLLTAGVALGAGQPTSALPTVSAPVHEGRPLRILIVGDSAAGTLGVGLAKAAKDANVEVINAASVGCSVSIGWDGAWASSIYIPSAPSPPCQSKEQLSSYWKSYLKRYQPDVVVYASRMDTVDQELRPNSSTMTGILDASFDSYLERSLTEAVDVLSSTGAHVILTTPAPTKIDLVGNVNDDPARDLRDAAIVHRVAAQSQGRASVFDLLGYFGSNSMPPAFELMSPSGIQWRCDDGIHFSPAGGILVAPSIFDAAWQAAADRLSTIASLPPAPSSMINQPWAPYAAQRSTMGCPPQD